MRQQQCLQEKYRKISGEKKKELKKSRNGRTCLEVIKDSVPH
jgi:hypothetical protein